MHSQKNSKPRMLVIPHVGRTGGAGIYINDFITAVSEKYHVALGGEFASAYTTEDLLFLEECVTRFVLPIYAGASYRALALRLIKNLKYKLCKDRCLQRCALEIGSYDVVMLTSSIQIPLIHPLKKLVPRIKLVVMIQENVRLNLPVLSSYFLSAAKKADLIISITDGWQRRATGHGLDSLVVSNTYRFEASKSRSMKRFDCLYVGGGSTLKGFRLVIELVSTVSESRPLRICMAGAYSEQETIIIKTLRKKVEHSGGVLYMAGFQTDLSSLYSSSQFLLLPITKPHFCRPAIEAAAHFKTFIIAGHRELEDFAVPNVNCLMFEPGSTKDLLQKFVLLLDDPNLCDQLGRRNRSLLSAKFGAQAHHEQITNAIMRLDHLKSS